MDNCQISFYLTSLLLSGKVGKQVEVVRNFIFHLSKVDNNLQCGMETRRKVLLCMRAMALMGKIWKSKHIKTQIKIRLVNAIIFPVAMVYGSEFVDHQKEGELPNKQFKNVVQETTVANSVVYKENKLINSTGSKEPNCTEHDHCETKVFIHQTHLVSNKKPRKFLSLAKLRDMVQDRGGWRKLITQITK